MTENTAPTAPTSQAEQAAYDETTADVYRRWQETSHRLAGYRETILHAAGARQTRGRWSMTYAEAAVDVRAKLDAGANVRGYYARDLERTFAAIVEHHAAADRLLEEFKAREAVYRSAPWSRFFLVPDGHVHSDHGCFTLRPTTVVRWLPALSGLTEADAVAAHGPMLCTHCFPTAPVEWTSGLPETVKPGYCAGALEPAVGERTTRRISYASFAVFATCSACGSTVKVKGDGRPHHHKAGA